MGPTFTTVAELAALVRDRDRVGVSGSLFSRLPVALVRAVCDAGRRGLHFISWGGGLPLEMLIAAGAVRSASFCFSSLDVLGLAPRFRKAVEDRAIEAQDWTALGMIQGLRATQHGLGSLPFVVPLGSDLVGRCGFASIGADPADGRPVAVAPALALDVMLLHAQRADEDGNVELQGARALDMSCVGAAARVLITVEEVVARGALSADRRGFVIPRTLVSAIAHAPGGAYPSSCLPHYVTDYRALADMVSQSELEVSPPTRERLTFVSRAAAIPAAAVTRHAWRSHRRDARGGEATPGEQMVVNLAREYTNDSVCSAGAVSPLAIVSYLLAKRTHAPRLSLITCSGGYIDCAPRPMLMTLAESVDFQTSVAHSGGDDTYHAFYQPGHVTHEVVAAAQIDRFATANNVRVTTPTGKSVRLPGQGGMADVANMHQHFVLYVTRHSRLTLVERVEYASAARGVLTDDDRRARGWKPGAVRVYTNLCTFALCHETRSLHVTNLNPGVTLDHVVEATGFKVVASSNLTESAPPTADELRILREEVDPLGFHRLEFVASKDRASLLQELIDGEEEGIRALLENGGRA